MRRISIAAASAVVALFASAALAQLGNLKGHIRDQMGNAVEQHNEDVENALNGDNSNKPPPSAQPAPPTDALKSGWMTRKSKDGKDVRLYFAYPGNIVKGKPIPALLVLQEWWGVNDDIQQRARDFATKGFYAVAPDLYYGKATDDPAQAKILHDAMTDATSMTAMKTGLDLLLEEAGNGIVDARHVCSIGWCMGGQESLLVSLADTRVKATVIFYGPLVTDPEKLKNLKGPVFGIFGNNDAAPSPADVDKFRDGLKTAGKADVTIYQFDSVGHAFASRAAEKLGLYNEAKSNEAWAKLWIWLDQKFPRK
jgi:carboxymethylenebutenolidase